MARKIITREKNYAANKKNDRCTYRTKTYLHLHLHYLFFHCMKLVNEMCTIAQISRVTVGAHHAALVEVLAGRSETPHEPFQVVFRRHYLPLTIVA